MKRKFIQLSRAWYEKSCLPNQEYVDEVMFGDYGEKSPTWGEMALRWYTLPGLDLPAAQLECFDDAFKALAQFPDVITALAAHEPDIQPEQFCRLLLAMGFEDVTPKEATK